MLGLAAAIAAPAAADPLKIVMVIHGATANEFWQPVKKGFEDACAKIQADCQMLFTNTNMSIQEELTNIDAALATNPDALILTIPDNNAFTKVVADARAKGIIVIAVNNDDDTRVTMLASPTLVRLSGLGHRSDEISRDPVPQRGPDQCPGRRQRSGRQLVRTARRRHREGARGL